MSEPSLIPSLQADALAREIEKQLKDESEAMTEAAQRDAQAIVAQARKTARTRLHQAIVELRREGERRMTRAKAEAETSARARQQQLATKALGAAMPLLTEALVARWRDAAARKIWTGKVAELGLTRLRRGAWIVEHPADWDVPEAELESALLADRPTLALVPDVLFRREPPDLAKKLRRVLGIEP